MIPGHCGRLSSLGWAGLIVSVRKQNCQPHQEICGSGPRPGRDRPRPVTAVLGRGCGGVLGADHPRIARLCGARRLRGGAVRGGAVGVGAGPRFAATSRLRNGRRSGKPRRRIGSRACSGPRRGPGACAGQARQRACAAAGGPRGRQRVCRASPTRFLNGEACPRCCGRAAGPKAVQGAVAACLPWRGRAPMAFAGQSGPGRRVE